MKRQRLCYVRRHLRTITFLTAPQGGTVLLDNIRFDPVPTSQQSALGFPLGNQTFGVLRWSNWAWDKPVKAFI